MKTIKNFAFNWKVTLLVVIWHFGYSNEILAQSVAKEMSIFDAVMTDSIRHFNLETDYAHLIRTKNKEVYQPAFLTFTNQQGENSKWKVQLRTRGNMRKRVCYFPPFKIKFDKSDLEKAALARDWNDIKVVTACKSGNVYDQYVIKEYLVYKLFNVLTDKSFRAQLITLHLQKEKGKPNEMIGFLIEPETQLATRYEGTVYEPRVLNPKYTLQEQYDLISVFQYMIGNTDWSVANAHNIKAIRTALFKLPFCVPYDFDYAGIVNTNYAVPHESLAIETVTERLFLGLCRDDNAYQKIAQLFIQKKADLYAVIKDCNYLIASEKQYMTSYMDDFFEIIEDEHIMNKKRDFSL